LSQRRDAVVQDLTDRQTRQTTNPRQMHNKSNKWSLGITDLTQPYIPGRSGKIGYSWKGNSIVNEKLKVYVCLCKSEILK